MLICSMERPRPTTTLDSAADDSRWQAVLRRDRSADGQFLFAVRTTGVYCRPSCGARTPRRENVSFFATGEEARAAGYRACKRCRPDTLASERVEVQSVAAAIRLIDSAVSAGEPVPPLETLADRAGYSPFHFHRLFRQATGMTPRAYAAARRAQAADDALAVEPRVTDAIYAAGYSSNSRFYAAAAQRLGMAPATRRKGAPGEVIRHVFGASSLGLVLVAATPKGVCAIALGDDRQALLDDLAHRFPRATLMEGDANERDHLAAVIGLIEEPRRTAALPLDVRGTVFQEQVWQALRRIPLGTTATYADLAAAVGRPAAVRAVAQACAANPTAVVVPCHRVVRSDGDLSGYRWGVERKAALLKREGAR